MSGVSLYQLLNWHSCGGHLQWEWHGLWPQLMLNWICWVIGLSVMTSADAELSMFWAWEYRSWHQLMLNWLCCGHMNMGHDISWRWTDCVVDIWTFVMMSADVELTAVWRYEHLSRCQLMLNWLCCRDRNVGYDVSWCWTDCVLELWIWIMPPADADPCI